MHPAEAIGSHELLNILEDKLSQNDKMKDKERSEIQSKVDMLCYMIGLRPAMMLALAHKARNTSVALTDFNLFKSILLDLGPLTDKNSYDTFRSSFDNRIESLVELDSKFNNRS
jgi:hypothetical protein